MKALFEAKYSMSIVTVLCVAMLFSCQNRLEEVRNLKPKKTKPQTTGHGIDLHYTIDGKLKAHLKTPKMLDFRNREFPYREFPDGLKVEFIDDDTGKKNTVYADYGIEYLQTDLIDLRGNVKIVTTDSTVLNAKQLYWDQDRDWVFSDKAYTIKMPDGALNNGQGFDANEKFDKFNSRSNEGIQFIKDSQK